MQKSLQLHVNKAKNFAIFYEKATSQSRFRKLSAENHDLSNKADTPIPAPLPSSLLF